MFITDVDNFADSYVSALCLFTNVFLKMPIKRYITSIDDCADIDIFVNWFWCLLCTLQNVLKTALNYPRTRIDNYADNDIDLDI